MHILEIPSFFVPHGGLFCLEQARALQARGHEVRILACTELGLTLDGLFYLTAPRGRSWIKMEGIEVYQSYYRAIPKAVQYNMARWCKMVKSMYRDYVARYGTPDLLHVHCCKYAGLAAYYIKREFHVPYFITDHLSSILFVKHFGENWSRYPDIRLQLKDAYEAADCVIPVSQELVEDLAPFFGRDYKYKVVSNIIDTDFFAYKERSKCEDRPFRYCCLAVANVYGKGYDVLAKAWHDMDGAELHIAGRGTDGEELSRLFAGSRNVTRHGNLDKAKVRDLLYHCDALVLPTRSEAQVLVVLEAMATGIPVVTTDVVAQSERLPGACLIAPVGDAEAFRSQMLQIQSVRCNPVFHSQVCALASPEVVAVQLEDIFLSAVRQ